jgi:phosphotransferase system enzyme I (PtsI)
VELHGTGVSPGIALGRALLVERRATPAFRLPVAAQDIEREVDRLRRAAEASRGQLQVIRDRLSHEIGVPHAHIFDAQMMMIEDPLLLERSVTIIREEGVNAEWALRTVADQLHALFEEFSDPYLKERSTDLDDVLGRVHINLAGDGDAPSLRRLPGEFVLVAEDLTPSQAGELDWARVLAVATDAGSRTYHTAILARSLGIPAVVGLKDATRRIPAGALVVVDGARGLVVVEPAQTDQDDYMLRRERERAEERRLQQTRALPCVTRDGVEIRLLANAEFAEEAATALLYGASGIGLFRSEYLLARSGGWPTEDEQVEVYRCLVEEMRPHPVTVRTWDVGPEDLRPGSPRAPNPALGERAFRLLRHDPEPFRTQLRALLRAGAHGDLRIMLPFVSGPADLRLALDLLEEARQGLRREGREFREDVAVGLTVEVPSAALTADLLARDVDFLSVGTNDLIQYLLAVDRVDPQVSALYQPLHPAVLRTIRSVVEAGERNGIPVALCGEMAADPLQALVLLGLGVRELSMNAASIPRVKQAVRRVSAEQAVRVSRRCLDLPTAAQVEGLVRQELAEALVGATA